VRSVQPGGGVCYQIELCWGVWRRWLLKRLRPGYVQRMAQLRRGESTGAPHEILDPRDLKFCRNLCSCDWDPRDDPFAWRDRIPFARWGLAELQIMGWPLLVLTVVVLHGFNGLRYVINDYAHSPLANRALNYALMFGAVALIVLGMAALLAGVDETAYRIAEDLTSLAS